MEMSVALTEVYKNKKIKKPPVYTSLVINMLLVDNIPVYRDTLSTFGNKEFGVEYNCPCFYSDQEAVHRC